MCVASVSQSSPKLISDELLIYTFKDWNRKCHKILKKSYERIFFNFRVKKTFIKTKESPSDNFDCIKIKHYFIHYIHIFQDITQMLFHWCLCSLNYNTSAPPPFFCIAWLLSMISILLCYICLPRFIVYYFSTTLRCKLDRKRNFSH